MSVNDDSFIKELYDRYYNNVYKLCLYRLQNDPCEANDCAQDVFCAALANREKLARHGDPEKWLYKTAYNIIKQRQRSLRRTRAHELPLNLYGEEPDNTDPYEPNLFTDEEIEALKMQIMSKLTDDERSLYTNRYEKRLSLEEIAKVYGISTAAVRLRVYRLNIKLDEYRKNIFFD